MKKRGFTLVELMAVVAIIAILAVVLVPTVSGYIKRAKKTAVISQTRIAVTAVRNSNDLGTGAYYIQEDAECCIVKDLIDSVNDEELVPVEDIDKLGNMSVKQAMAIVKDQDALKNIEVDDNGVFSTYKGEKPKNEYTLTGYNK